MNYDQQLRIAELEGERRAVIDLADAYARLDYERIMAHQRELADAAPPVSPGQLRLVIG